MCLQPNYLDWVYNIIQSMTGLPRQHQYMGIPAVLAGPLHSWDPIDFTSLLDRSSVTQLARFQPFLFVTIRKFVLNLSNQNSQSNLRTATKILVILKANCGKTKRATLKIQYFLRKVFKSNPVLEARVKQEEERMSRAEGNKSSIPKNPRVYRQKIENLEKVNKNLRMLMEDELFVQVNDCLGCLKVFYKDKPYDLDSFNQNYLIYSSNIFQKQEQMIQNICALLNARGGYIFITGECDGDTNTMQGLALTNQDKNKYTSFFGKCMKYIEPVAERDTLTVDFIPLIADPLKGSTNEATKQVVRINLRPHKSRFLYYISYKLMASDKKLEVQFFNYSPHQIVTKMQFSEIYTKINNFYVTNTYALYDTRHRGIKCYEPYRPDPLHHVQLAKIESATGKSQKSPQKKTQVPNKFRHSLLIIKAKGGKQDEKKIQTLQKQIVNNKILCEVENIEIQKNKNRIWLISFDCLSQIVESIVKMFNRNGELAVLRTRRCIRIQDQQFLSQRKDEQLLRNLRALVEKQEDNLVEYMMYNTEQKKLNPSSKKPVYLKFRNPRHAILSYAMVYENNRRIQFIQTKH